eukprot:10174949-Alexandrium_andersonii.AAC.1
MFWGGLRIPFCDERSSWSLSGGATAPRTPRLAPPVRVASPGGATAPRTPPIGASGAPEAPVGGVRGG